MTKQGKLTTHTIELSIEIFYLKLDIFGILSNTSSVCRPKSTITQYCLASNKSIKVDETLFPRNRSLDEL